MPRQSKSAKQTKADIKSVKGHQKAMAAMAPETPAKRISPNVSGPINIEAQKKAARMGLVAKRAAAILDRSSDSSRVVDHRVSNDDWDDDLDF